MADVGDVLPVTALRASEPGAPVVIFDGNAALRMAVVDRQSVAALDDAWDGAGIYLLLDPVTLDGAYGVYVGKAPGGLRVRLRQHTKGKDHWARALLVTRDTTHGWHSAQVGWLEGRLYDLLDGASLATLSNGNRPQDETVPAYDRAALEAAVEPIAAVLRLLGCSPDTFDEDAPTESAPRSAPRQYHVTVADLMAAGDLTAGERVTSTQISLPAVAVVGEDGSLSIEGQRFATPSAAGSHVRGGKAANGWSFWAVERDGSTVPLATIRARHLRRIEPDRSTIRARSRARFTRTETKLEPHDRDRRPADALDPNRAAGPATDASPAAPARSVVPVPCGSVGWRVGPLVTAPRPTPVPSHAE